jgi:translocation and assembly module TamB
MGERPRLERLGRVAHTALGTGVAAVVFVVGCAGSLVLHGDLPATKRAVARVATAGLGTIFKGQIVVEHLEHLGFDGVDVGAAHVLDPWGKMVLRGEGVHVRVSLPRLVWSVMPWSAPLRLRLDDVRVDEGEVLLDVGPEGQNRIAAAFERRPAPGPPKPPPVPEPPPTPIRIELPQIAIGHVWAHGDPVGGLLIDADGFKVPGAVLVTQDAITVDVERFGLRARAPAPLLPAGTAEYHLRAGRSAPVKMWTSFQGDLGEMYAGVSANLEGAKLEAAIDVPRASPREIQSLLPGLPLTETVSLRLLVGGSLPDLEVKAHAVAGPSEVDLVARGRVGMPLRVAGDVHVRDLDPRLFDANAPPASLGGDAEATLVVGPGTIEATVSAKTFPFTLAGQSVPGAGVTARYATGEVKVEADVYEPGIPTTVRGTVETRTGLVTFVAEARASSLAKAPRLRGAIDGAVSATVSGSFLAATGFDATVDAELRNVGKGNNRLGSGRLKARVVGQPAALALDGQLKGHKIRLGSEEISGASVSARGPLLTPRVKVALSDPRWSALEVSGTARLGGRRPTVTGVKGLLTLDEVATTLEVGELAVVKGGVSLRRVSVESGVGELHGDVGLDAAGLQASLDGKVDFVKLGRALRWMPVTAGDGNFSVRLRSEGSKREGNLSVSLREGEVMGLPLMLTAGADVAFHDERITAKVKAALGGSGAKAGEELELARLDASAEATVPGGLFARRSWERATGEARVSALDLMLDNVYAMPLVKAALMVRPSLPVMSGEVHATASAARESSESLPHGNVTARTTGFSLVVPAASRVKGAAPALAIDGVDAALAASVAPAGGAEGQGNGGGSMSLQAGLDVTDREGALAVVRGQSTFNAAEALADLWALARAERGTPGSEAALARLGGLDAGLRINIPVRELEKLPALLRPEKVAGRVSADVVVTGTLAHPRASFTTQVVDLVAAAAGVAPWPVYGAFTGTFSDAGAEVAGSLNHKGGEEKAELGLSAHVGLGDLIWRRPALAAWKVDVNADLKEFHLEALPGVGASGFGATVTGQVKATDLHDAPKVHVDVQLEHVRVVDTELDGIKLTGWISEGAGVVRLSMDQPPGPDAPEGGKLLVTALPSVHFAEGLHPELNPIASHVISARLEHFDVEPFSPLTAPVLADLRGFIDGEATLTLGKRAGPGGAMPTELWGGLKWSDGVVLIPQLGQTLTRGTATVQTVVGTDNTTYIAVRDLSLDATTGRLKGSAQVALPNDLILLSLLRPPRGATPAQHEEHAAAIAAARARFIGHAQLEIAKREKIPVTFEGVPLGDAYGSAEASLRLGPEGTDIVIGVPELTFELPDGDGRTHGVQDLASNPDVGIVDRKFQGEATKALKPRERIKITVGLGSQLGDMVLGSAEQRGTILVRRAGLDASLRGQPVLTLSDAGLRVDGSVQTLSGRVLALGKPFDVQQGSVEFRGQANNPYVNLSAVWESPDGSRVYAELVGFLKDLKLRLRSDPPRPENEVLALVLLGRDPTTAPQPGQTQAGASSGVAVGSGVASTLLTSMLDPVQIFGRRIETRVDTTSTRGTSIGVAAEIRPRLWATVDVSTAKQQERQNADLSTVQLDWRFRPNWSLRTTVGDRGSSTMELLWQHRY